MTDAANPEDDLDVEEIEADSDGEDHDPNPTCFTDPVPVDEPQPTCCDPGGDEEEKPSGEG